MTKGSVQVKNGIWYTLINYKDKDGNYKQKWQTTNLKERGNKKEAVKMLEERLLEFEQALQTKAEKLKRRTQPAEAEIQKANWLFTKYLAEYVESIKDRLSPTVYYNYSVSYMKYFKEYFDSQDLRLIDITAKEIIGFYNHRRQRGVKDTTLKHITCVLQPALRAAFKANIIPDNPYDFVPGLKREKAITNYYTKEELELLFQKIKGHSMELAIRMLAHYGFRRSELLGLRWQAIDFEHDTITINHKILVVKKVLYCKDELKTKTSYRTLPLISQIKAELLKHKETIEQNKQTYGNAYDMKFADYVFVKENGSIVYPDHLSHAFSKVLKLHQLKHIRLHDLRHSCASLLLANGIPIKQIQDWLGHANFSTTADIYSHLDFSTKVHSANTIAASLNFSDKDETDGNKELNSFRENIAKDMQRLGIKTADEYFEYLATLNGKNS